MSLYDHLEKLQYFMGVAKAGSFKRASEQLHLTQPTLSKSIKILEESLETELFVRHARGIELTNEGEFLFERCLLLFNQLDEISKELHSPLDPLEQKIRVGTFDSIAIYFWGSFLKKFLSKRKTLQIEMTTKRSSEIQQELEAGNLDLAIIVDPRPNSQFESLELFSDQFRFYESALKKKSYESIKEAPLILMNQTLSEKEQESALMGHCPPLYQVSSLESAKEFCIQGLGVALLPEQVAKKSLDERKIKLVESSFKPYAQSLQQHSIALVYPKRLSQSKTLQSMIKDLHSIGPL
jgi:DNA-binding transcriptional LysR family regulator